MSGSVQEQFYGFVDDLVARLPEGLVVERRWGLPTPYGAYIHFSTGGRLNAFYRDGQKMRAAVSSIEPATGHRAIPVVVVDVLRDMLHTHPAAERLRRKLIEDFNIWSGGTSPTSADGREVEHRRSKGSPGLVVQGGSPHDEECRAAEDPILAMPPGPRIRVRTSSSNRTGSTSTENLGESGKSQERGRTCESIAFKWLCSLYPQQVSGQPDSEWEVTVRKHSGEALVLKWLNGVDEDGGHWDISELDEESGLLTRCYEVKAPSADLTEAEYQCALDLSVDYFVVRVDPDSGLIESATKVNDLVVTPEAVPNVETGPATQKEPQTQIGEVSPVVALGKPTAGGWFLGTGRRKAAVARVRIRAGSGTFQVNGRELEEYFTQERDHKDIVAVLEATNTLGDLEVQVKVHGGGYSGQAGAIRLGLGRSLMRYDGSLEQTLRDHGFLTRDPRRVERKKPGQPGARKRFQFSKR